MVTVKLYFYSFSSDSKIRFFERVRRNVFEIIGLKNKILTFSEKNLKLASSYFFVLFKVLFFLFRILFLKSDLNHINSLYICHINYMLYMYDIYEYKFYIFNRQNRQKIVKDLERS